MPQAGSRSGTACGTAGGKEFAAPPKRSWARSSQNLVLMGTSGPGAGCVIIATEGVEGKETKPHPSCTLINMQEVILPFECINLPAAFLYAFGMRGARLSQGEPCPNFTTFQTMPHLLTQAAPSLGGLPLRPPSVR